MAKNKWPIQPLEQLLAHIATSEATARAIAITCRDTVEPGPEWAAAQQAATDCAKSLGKATRQLSSMIGHISAAMEPPDAEATPPD